MRGTNIPDAGDELRSKLKSLSQRIEALERRPDGRITGQQYPGWWLPQVRAVTTNPGGTRDLRQGIYWMQPIMNVTDWVTVGGWGLVRIDSASATRGSGFYLLDLPFAPDRPRVNGTMADPWFKLGTVTLGFSDGVGTHRSALSLHRNGISPGTAGAAAGTTRAAIIATNTDALFVDESNPKPGVDVINVHYTFNYAVPKPEENGRAPRVSPRRSMPDLSRRSNYAQGYLHCV